MKRLLITGINGLIGTVLMNAFQERYEIYGLDREGPFSERIVETDIASSLYFLMEMSKEIRTEPILVLPRGKTC